MVVFDGFGVEDLNVGVMIDGEVVVFLFEKSFVLKWC